MTSLRVDSLELCLDTSKSEVLIHYHDRPVAKKMHLNKAQIGEFAQALAKALTMHLDNKFNVNVHAIKRSKDYETTVYLARHTVVFYTKKPDGTGYSSPYYELSLGRVPKALEFLLFSLRTLCGIRES